MAIDLVFNNSTAEKKYQTAFFRKIIEAAANELWLKSKKIELSINLAGERKIRSLNKSYRNKDKLTDVLSFPLHEGKDAKSGGHGIISLGDIFICLSIAKRDAIREKIALGGKLAFLAVHGFLHLNGYNHEKSVKERKKMFDLQDKIIKRMASGI